ncbi:MAG TPA: GGDEF domain-containing protein [Candidatus Limnocylindrales bacterium]|nr:GGDEF domain-containing protein [Candidatus Limnocylindrales bacterium]
MTPDPLLLAAIRAVARSGDPDATLDELLEIGLRAAGGDRAAAFLWDAEAGGLALAGARGYPPDDLPTLEDAVKRQDHPVRLAAEERIQSTGQPGGEGRLLLAWPIVVGRDGIEEPVGALAFEADRAPDADVGERVAALADLVAVVVDRARLATNAAERIDWAERMANSDALTGLANGRTLQRVLELELARAARQKLEVSVAIFDVDDLTGLNDAHGKAAGDDTLREVAAVISETVRFVDTVARWGGDEFLLVAPGATGNTVAQRILDAVRAKEIAGRPCTVSAGLARFPIDGATGQDLIAAATAALRAAQAVGPGTLAEAARDGNGAGSGISSGAASA